RIEQIATTVGKPCDGVEVSIADDSEVLIRGYNVMQRSSRRSSSRRLHRPIVGVKSPIGHSDDEHIPCPYPNFPRLEYGHVVASAVTHISRSNTTHRSS